MEIEELALLNLTYFETNFTRGYNTTRFATLADFANSLNIYFTPFIICFGVIGNLLSLLVFYSSKLKNQVSSSYLSALAVSDTIFLIQLLYPWLNALHVSNLFNLEGFCQVFVYTTYVTTFASAWLVVAFTVERFVAVVYPLRRSVLCSVGRARYLIAVISVGALFINLPVFKFATRSTIDCTVDRQFMALAERFNIADTILAFTVPLVTIFVMNVWIITGVIRVERARNRLVRAERTQGPLSRGRLLRQFGRPQAQHRITRMLLVVSTVYIILNMPAYVMRIMAYAYDLDANSLSGQWEPLQQFAICCFNTNFAINFVLYCCTGQNFRRELMNAFTKLRRSTSSSISVCRPTSFHPQSTYSIYGSYAGTEDARSRRDTFISRWIFDNSRQREDQEVEIDAIELAEITN